MAKKIFNAIGTIYSAPGNNEGWAKAVESITELVGGKASAYILVNGETLENEISAFHGFRQVDRERYEGPLGAAKDIRFHYLHNLIPGNVFREFEFVTDKEAYNNSEWIKYQLKELGVYWCLSAQISTHGLWKDYISVNRLKKLGPHTEPQKRNLKLLLPHLSRAAELHRTMTSLKQRYGSVLSVLDQLLIGLVILDDKQKVATSNRTAFEVCETSGVVQITPDGKVIARNSDQNLALQKQITDSCLTATNKGFHEGGQIPLSRGDKHVLVEVIPIRDDGLPDGDNIHGAAVFLMDPSLGQVVSLDGISKMFSLTLSESDIAQAVANGNSLNNIADKRNTSVETIRKQLKAVFSKTGVNSQLELLRLASKASPPIRRNE